MKLKIDYLAHHSQCMQELQSWFESQWEEHYGLHGEGDAAMDIASYSNTTALPLGLVAKLNNELCGFAVLREETFPTHPHLAPWLGAAIVKPELRGQGIGARIFIAIEEEAKARHFKKIYCATATSGSLLERNDWTVIDRVMHLGDEVVIYEKTLA